MRRMSDTKVHNYIAIIFLIMVVFACSYEQYDQQKTNRKPNVILFLVDDLGWTDAGVYGTDLYKTPHVDRLASEGIKFTDAYSACTVCSPTRASILTGKYPATINCTDWITGYQKPHAKLKIPDWTMYMDTSEYTLTEVLQDNGYKTYHLGKWHLGNDTIYWPENQGFDQNFGGHEAGSPVAYDGGGYFSPYNNPRLEDGPEGEYLTERLAREAADIIKNTDRPFFLNFWLYNVHWPLQAKDEKIQKYDSLVNVNNRHQNATYAAMVEHMDDALGKVIEALDSSGQADNTIIIFYSDNGGLIGRKRVITNNHPLRSGKGDIYEGGVRVPLIIRWPDEISPGQTTNTMAISPDIYPTIMSLIGLDRSAYNSQQVDGVDLSDLLLQGDSVKRQDIFWHYPHYHAGGARPYSAVRSGDWKLIHKYESDSSELYNLKEDIGETHDLTHEYPEKVKELTDKLYNWLDEVNAQMPSENPNYIPEK